MNRHSGNPLRTPEPTTSYAMSDTARCPPDTAHMRIVHHQYAAPLNRYTWPWLEPVVVFFEKEEQVFPHPLSFPPPTQRVFFFPAVGHIRKKKKKSGTVSRRVETPPWTFAGGEGGGVYARQGGGRGIKTWGSTTRNWKYHVLLTETSPLSKQKNESAPPEEIKKSWKKKSSSFFPPFVFFFYFISVGWSHQWLPNVDDLTYDEVHDLIDALWSRFCAFVYIIIYTVCCCCVLCCLTTLQEE